MTRTQNKLREIRTRKGMHLQEIADRIDTSVSTISSLERGTRNLTLDWIERLSEALDCHPSEIIGWPAPGLQQWEADLVEIFQHLGADIRTMKMIDAAETGMYRLANEGSPEVSDRLDELRQHYLDELKERLDTYAASKF